jgi:hypothetical protein
MEKKLEKLTIQISVICSFFLFGLIVGNYIYSGEVSPICQDLPPEGTTLDVINEIESFERGNVLVHESDESFYVMMNNKQCPLSKCVGSRTDLKLCYKCEK